MTQEEANTALYEKMFEAQGAGSIVNDIDKCLHDFTHGPENSHRALALGNIDTNSVH